MQLCLLGSEGQIGSYVQAHCRSEGIKLVNVDIVLDPQHDLRILNSFWIKAIEDSDVVIFLAFDVGGANYLRKHQDSYEFLSNNLTMMMMLSQLMALAIKCMNMPPL